MEKLELIIDKFKDLYVSNIFGNLITLKIVNCDFLGGKDPDFLPLN
jgi:hypothetical protein